MFHQNPIKMMQPDKFAAFCLLMIMISYHQLPAQHITTSVEKCAGADSLADGGHHVSILFWNAENLFDYRDDTLTADEEFTGSGAMHWGYAKLQSKLAHIAKTILAAGEWDPPALVGMCEVENRHVLNKLIYASPLKRFGYRAIHRDSPDNRGIDVALLFREEYFVPIKAEWITIRFPFDTSAKTRDILYVKGMLLSTDTLHLFVNHWPSRRGGEAVSAPRRNFVAGVLRGKVDSIIQSAGCSRQEPPSNGQVAVGSEHQGTMAPWHHNDTVPDQFPFILIMGDFNDEPENGSLCRILRAHLDTIGLLPTSLVNLSYVVAGNQGSHKFREHWGLLDQFIVSGTLIDRTHPLQADPGSLRIFRAAFLLEDDLKYIDMKPKRTYLGPSYKGGFSDHLPIMVEIRKLSN